MTIREARPADIPALMALERESYNEYTCESEEVFRRRLEVFPQGFLAAEDGGRLAGAICSEIWLHPAALDAELFALGHPIERRFSPGGDTLYVSSLAVFPAYRKHGAGGLLFTELFSRVKKNFPRVSRAVLLVNEDWLPARRLYARSGFTETARFPAFFRADDGSPRAGIVMESPLPQGQHI